MTIQKAIDLLEKLRKEYGNVEVFFDCPDCAKSFTPDLITAVAIHITQKK